jgi:membrane peptidoglycan carboxypeptidase
VMGKTGTTNDFRDAIFVGSTYGRGGLTVAVRIGFDDARSLGPRETGGRAALPVFRDLMGGIYARGLAPAPPQFPPGVEGGIDAYLRQQLPAAEPEAPSPWGPDEAVAALPPLLEPVPGVLGRAP